MCPAPSDHPTRVSIPDHTGFGLIGLESASGLRAQFLPSGALFALRHRQILINQLLPGPAEEGLFRLLVRWHVGRGPGGEGPLTEAGAGSAAVVGPGRTFGRIGPRAVAWTTHLARGLDATATFALHPTRASWAWRLRVRNDSTSALWIDALHAQDLGLADEAAVRNNEAYVSQYLDLLAVAHPALGRVVLARQNQAMTGGLHPWLGVACVPGAAAFCTDGWQFFGVDHRLSAQPLALRRPSLPSQRLQYEFALAGLQSRMVDLPLGGSRRSRSSGAISTITLRPRRPTMRSG
jgi:CRISPR-associated protein Csx3